MYKGEGRGYSILLECATHFTSTGYRRGNLNSFNGGRLSQTTQFTDPEGMECLLSLGGKPERGTWYRGHATIGTLSDCDACTDVGSRFDLHICNQHSNLCSEVVVPVKSFIGIGNSDLLCACVLENWVSSPV